MITIGIDYRPETLADFIGAMSEVQRLGLHVTPTLERPPAPRVSDDSHPALDAYAVLDRKSCFKRDKAEKAAGLSRVEAFRKRLSDGDPLAVEAAEKYPLDAPTDDASTLPDDETL